MSLDIMSFLVLMLAPSIFLMFLCIELLLNFCSSYLNNFSDLYRNFEEYEMMDFLSFNLSVMTMILVFGCMLMISQSSLEDLSLTFLMVLMTSSCLEVFMTETVLSFYLSFEIASFPIFLMILGWGYQPERLSAGFALLVYTLSGALPFLLLLVSLQWNSTSEFFEESMSMINSAGNWMTVWMYSGIFLIKLPMFLTHSWLPLAHVEAPVYGSMFLAGVLLKLGGVGLIRMSKVSEKMGCLWLIGLVTLVVIGMFCVSASDMKILIAYSSVAHMALALSAIVSDSAMGVLAGLMIFITHGFSSSMMFMMAHFMYVRSGTRSLVLSQNSLSWSPIFSFMWFFSCVGLMGGPPASTLLSEMLGMLSAGSSWFSSWAFLVMGAFLGGAYSLILFIRVFNGNQSLVLYKFNSFTYFETLISFYHLFWLLSYFWVFSWILSPK